MKVIITFENGTTQDYFGQNIQPHEIQNIIKSSEKNNKFIKVGPYLFNTNKIMSIKFE